MSDTPMPSILPICSHLMHDGSHGQVVVCQNLHETCIIHNREKAKLRAKVKVQGSQPGIEPGTTSTLKMYHTPRPLGLLNWQSSMSKFYFYLFAPFYPPSLLCNYLMINPISLICNRFAFNCKLEADYSCSAAWNKL